MSLVVPVHNRVELLPQTLASLVAQTFGDFECLLVNDRTDGDLAAAVPADPRFRILDLPAGKQGAPAARNFGFAQSSGDYVIFLDSDDLLEPNALARRVELLDARPTLDFVVTACQMFRQTPGDSGLLWNTLFGRDPDDLRRFLRRDTVWQTSSPTWRRDALRRLGGWDERCRSGQDWEFHVRALLKHFRYEKVDEVDHHWRQAGPQQSIGKSAWQNAEYTKAWSQQLRRSTNAVIAARGPEQYRKELSAAWFEVARRFGDQVSRRESRQLLRDLAREGLISLDELIAGLTYFYGFSWPFVMRRAKQRLVDLGRGDFLTLPNGTFNRTLCQTPRVSVVIPVYNAERYLEQAIESVSGQSFRELEIIAINDGSTDRSGQILDRLATGDARLRVIHQANSGIVDSLNRGIALARGHYIARMDGDDVSMRERFMTQVAFLDGHADVVCVGGQCHDVGPHDTLLDYYEFPTGHDDIEQMLLHGHGGVLRHPAVLIRKSALEQVGGYRKQYEWCEDLDLWLRLAEIGKLANLPDVVLHYRQHPKSVVRTKRDIQLSIKRKIVAEAFERRGREMPVDWELNQWQPDGPNKLIREWGWRSMKQKRIAAARQHAVDLVRREPMSIDSWRLLYCSVRGR